MWVSMWNLGWFHVKLIFCQSCSASFKFESKNPAAHMTHNCDYILCTVSFLHFSDSFPNFDFLLALNLPSLTLIYGSILRQCFWNWNELNWNWTEKSRNSIVYDLFLQTVEQNNSLTLIVNKFRFFRSSELWVQGNITLWPKNGKKNHLVVIP